MARAIGAMLFVTPLGWCGIAWSAKGIVGVQLPEAEIARTRERLQRRHGVSTDIEAPLTVQRAILGIQQLLEGQAVDLDDTALDLDGVPALHQRVYAIVRSIPAGATLTYGDIATRLGDQLLARAVGQALARNPIAIIVPCHRVLAAGGRSGGFSAVGGVSTKLRLLSIEGAQAHSGPDLFSSPILQRQDA